MKIAAATPCRIKFMTQLAGYMAPKFVRLINLSAGVRQATVQQVAGAAQPVAKFRGTDNSFPRREKRLEGCVHVRRDVDIERRVDQSPQLTIDAIGRCEKPGSSFNGRVGMRQIGGVQYGYAVKFHKGIPVRDVLGFLIVRYVEGLYLPDWGSCRIFFA